MSIQSSVNSMIGSTASIITLAGKTFTTKINGLSNGAGPKVSQNVDQAQQRLETRRQEIALSRQTVNSGGDDN